VLFGQRGLDGRLLIGELVLPPRGLMLGVNLLGTGYDVAACGGAIAIATHAGVPPDGGTVTAGACYITTLQPREAGRPEPPPPSEAVSPSSEESSRMACNNDDPLWVIPTNTAPEAFPSLERSKRPKRLATNSRLPKKKFCLG
jgi:hypothetical protein